MNTSFKPKAKENTLIKSCYKAKNLNYNYNEDDIEENNSKESNEEWNASKIPQSDFNQNNLIEITKRETKSKIFSKSQPDENESNLISFTVENSNYEDRKINNLNGLKEFNFSDNSFARTFSPKNSSYQRDKCNSDNTSANQGAVFGEVSRRFPKMPKKYSDIASIIKKDINEVIKKEKEKEKEKDFEVDSTRKYSSLSVNNTNNTNNNNTTANTNYTNNIANNANSICNSNSISNCNNNISSNTINLPESKTEEIKEKKPQKLNLFDILSGSISKDEYYIITFFLSQLFN